MRGVENEEDFGTEGICWASGSSSIGISATYFSFVFKDVANEKG